MAGEKLKIVACGTIVRIRHRAALMRKAVHNQRSATCGHVVQRAYDLGSFREFHHRGIGPVVGKIRVHRFRDYLGLEGDALGCKHVGNGPQRHGISKWAYVFQAY
jgi:hypothetical protein